MMQMTGKVKTTKTWSPPQCQSLNLSIFDARSSWLLWQDKSWKITIHYSNWMSRHFFQVSWRWKIQISSRFRVTTDVIALMCNLSKIGFHSQSNKWEIYVVLLAFYCIPIAFELCLENHICLLSKKRFPTKDQSSTAFIRQNHRNIFLCGLSSSLIFKILLVAKLSTSNIWTLKKNRVGSKHEFANLNKNHSYA